MQDLMQHFSLRDQPLPGGDQTLQQNLRFAFVRMEPADQAQRNIGIDENQSW